mmetsp:Transcript_1149/g.2328  ORF Transcript_1149/g.2328 Transcript_1149/m.2328 type:complete len:277 (-) Transcript_1149:43-873(-)
MCDPCILWSLAGGTFCSRTSEIQFCDRLLLCARNVPEQATQETAPPRQEKLQEPCEELLDVARPLKVRSSRSGLRARPHAFRCSALLATGDEEPLPSFPASRSRSLPVREVQAGAGFLCTEASASSDARPVKTEAAEASCDLSEAPFLAVECEAESSPQKQRRRSGRRSVATPVAMQRFRRRRSSGRRVSRSSASPQVEDGTSEAWAAQAGARAVAAAELMAAQGYSYRAGAWDWPLSRLEKKARLVTLDIQVLKADRDELVEEVQHLRRQSRGEC